MVNKTKDKSRRRRGHNKDGKQKESGAAGHSSLLVQLNDEAPTWFKVAWDFPERNATLLTHSTDKPQSASLVEKYRSQADEIYRQEVQLFNAKANDKDANWMHATMSKGTLKDRIAAMGVTVSTDPVHRFYAIDGLLQMAGCLASQGAPNSRVAQLAGEALIELFLRTLLPRKRKLVTLAQRPLHLYEKSSENAKKPQKTLSPRLLLLWRFEEMVHEKYHLFVKKYFGYMLREGNDMQKIPAIRAASELLKSVPEGEATLLSAIVNKLGDPARKVAASAAHALRVVLQQHAAMQNVVAREVQQLAHRPHLSDRALYNCITFLNQLTLHLESEDDPVEERLPSSLVQTYFRLFEVAVRMDEKKKQEEQAVAMKGRLLSALLTGVNRAHPYLAKSLGELDEHVNSLYRVVHKSPPSACTQALLLLFHLTVGTSLEGEESFRNLSDEAKAHQKRFYVALYSKLAQPVMVGSGKHLTMFFNLVYKSMKYDNDKNRVLAFAKRIMCTAIHCSSAIVSAALFLLSEIGKSHPEVLQCHKDVLDGKDALRSYDMREQDPSKAIKLPSSGEESGQSDTSIAPAWEMCLAIHHYHPTVQAFTRNLGGIEYKGDPLRDFSLAPFLDKFAYRNPKSSDKVAGKFSRGNSVAERRSGNERRIEGHFALPFNDPSFVQRQNVDVEDQFFHQYFVERAKRDEMKGITRRKSEDDKDSEDESGDEDNAFGAAEADVSDFGKYEQNWESDEEEEAFVDSLAQKIIEDSMDANELGPDELDAEDPDMDDWDDMYADEKEGDGGDAAVDDEDDSDASEAEENADFLDSDSDDQDGREQDDSASSSDDMEKRVEADEDAFMDDSDNDNESDEEVIDEDAIRPQFHEDEDDDLGWINNEDEDGEDSPDELPDKARGGKKGKKSKDMPTFASLEDYEEKINASWQQIKRSSETRQDESDEEVEVKEKKKKRRKR